MSVGFYSPKRSSKQAMSIGLMCVALAGAFAAGGCRGDRSDKRPRQIMPGMDDQQKYMTQAASDFFDDGRAMRKPVTGVVAFGASANPDFAHREDFLRADSRVYRGMNADGTPVPTMPLAAIADIDGNGSVTEAEMHRFLERGRDRYNIYCIVCHGGTGEGDGTVGAKWASIVANLQDEKFKDRATEQGTDGHLFDIVRNGLANPDGSVRMPGYAQQVNVRDAWAIVAYVRALQATREGNMGDITETQRKELRRQTGSVSQHIASDALATERKGAADGLGS